MAQEKINIAEILKDVPEGTELYCSIFGYVKFIGVKNTGYANMIQVDVPIKGIEVFYEDGRYNKYYSDSECVLFPSKENRDWSKFQIPFNDGDIIYNQGIRAVAIFWKQTDDATISYCFLNMYKEFKICHYHSKLLYDWRLATEEEKQKLFDAIKENGYKWNAETKTLDKLIVPKFKVGDKVKSKHNKDHCYLIEKLTDTHYTIIEVKSKFRYIELFIEDNNWTLVPNKFDINTLVPFESKVLVRDGENQYWRVSFWGCFFKSEFMYDTARGRYKQCIPYEGNEHLLGKKGECEEYYKTWE